MEPKVIIPNPNRSARSVDFDALSCGHCAAPPAKSCDYGDKTAVVEQRLGWPLLRRTPSGVVAKQGEQETRKQSVVHWVMSLPRRSSPSASPEPPLEGLAADLKRLLADVPSRCRWFRYEELYDSTNHFSPGEYIHKQTVSSESQSAIARARSIVENINRTIAVAVLAENLVGKGAHSRVYKGSLASGQQVAIKLCKASAEASKDFLREVEIITKLQHERIVPLIGVCVEGRNLVSVYRYLPRGSLEDNLHGTTYSASTYCSAHVNSEFRRFRCRREEIEADAAVGKEVQGGGRGRRGAQLRPLRQLAAGDPQRRQVLQHPAHGRSRASGIRHAKCIL
jgi:hypothetical protein